MAKFVGGNFIPAIVATVAIVGFFVWLNANMPDPSVAVTEPGDTTTAGPAQPSGGPATVVDPQTMTTASNVRALVGQTIELQSVPVSSPMGAQLFWIELPGGSPYLVKLDDASVAAGRSVPNSGNVRIVGRILEKNEAVLQQWMQSGVLSSPDQKIQAEFGTTYLEASQVTPAGG